MEHSPRESFWKFSKQLRSYGKGRIKHFFIRPQSFSPVYLLPAIFLLYIFLLPLLFGLTPYLVPGLIYLLMLSVFSVYHSLKLGKLGLVPHFLLSFPLLHLSYGFGLLSGLFECIFSNLDKKEWTDEEVSVVQQLFLI